MDRIDNACDEREGAEADDSARQRLLEGWLPLAQDANQQYNWALDAPTLEALVLEAAASLNHARSALEARAMLWHTFQSLYPEYDR